jgi:glutamate racemase
LSDAAIQPLLSLNCDVIVIACNTATAIAIKTLRTKYPNQRFVGIEPMIKTAAKLSKTRTVAVCATPATLNSQRYSNLKTKYGSDIQIIEPDCSKWAKMIECNDINHQMIEGTIKNVCDQNADVIVLGCTHYHWIKDEIIKLSLGYAQVIEPSEAIGRRIKSILKLG